MVWNQGYYPSPLQISTYLSTTYYTSMPSPPKMAASALLWPQHVFDFHIENICRISMPKTKNVTESYTTYGASIYTKTSNLRLYHKWSPPTSSGCNTHHLMPQPPVILKCFFCFCFHEKVYSKSKIRTCWYTTFGLFLFFY